MSCKSCGTNHESETKKPAPQKVKDPVCGMMIDSTGKQPFRFEGKDYFFCSASCALEFRENPRKFLG